MKKIIKIFLIFIIIFITVDIICDVLAPAFYYIKFSSNYEYMIVMIPSDTKDIKKRHIGRGIVFEMYPKVYEMFDERTYDTFGIFSNKTALKLYEVDWYSMLVDISNDGNILVRYGPWSPDSKEFYEEELIIIAIYEKGKLLKQYTARELMLNDKSPRFISSYEFRQVRPW